MPNSNKYFYREVFVGSYCWGLFCSYTIRMDQPGGSLQPILRIVSQPALAASACVTRKAFAKTPSIRIRNSLKLGYGCLRKILAPGRGRQRQLRKPGLTVGLIRWSLLFQMLYEAMLRQLFFRMGFSPSIQAERGFVMA